MDLTIEQGCPSCGAPITLHEEDRLLRCPYCDVGNYLIAEEEASRFVLPDKAPDHIPRADLLYAPYVRFKGNLFSCRGRQVDSKVIDTTYLCADLPFLPPSLGVRPQAMKIRPVTCGVEGRFFPQTEKALAVFARATELAAVVKETSEPLYHRAFVGETISRIYLPLYLQAGGVYDAIVNRPVGEVHAMGEMLRQTIGYNPAWSPRFLATLCPQCAGTLAGEYDSLILSCGNCSSLWQECGGTFKPVQWRLLRSTGGRPHYLPFWRIRPAAVGAALATFGDFLRLTNQPIVVREVHERMEFRFWIPAFKIRPHHFLQLARGITLTQARLPDGDAEMAEKMHPVTLPSSEAVQALKTVLADMTMDKRHFLPQLPAIHFDAGQAELVYLPFAVKGQDLVQDQTSVSLAVSVLQFGRSL